jgi:UDP-2-acetamido-2-deoxy-ribo-hexuluronate aminotransferase
MPIYLPYICSHKPIKMTTQVPAAPIAMVDLQAQYQKIKPEVDRAMQEVIDTTQFINGAAVCHFAQHLADYLGAAQVIPCGNGTDALQIALMALNLKPGDEVITAPFTFVATAEVIALLGLKPVFVDVTPDTFCIDETLIEAAITPKTRCIIPVHLFGQGANMEAIMNIAHRHNLFVVEDNAQAIGADFRFSDGSVKKLGTIGHIGCTSFFPSKNLGAYGDGGALFCNDPEIADRLTMIVNHGMKVRYYHDLVGVNSRLDTLQAVVLDVKLRHLETYNASRRAAAHYYNKGFQGLKGLQTPVEAPYSTHVFHQYTLLVENGRDELKNRLQEVAIPSAVYYPVPLHLQKAYADSGYRKGDFPVSEFLAEKVLSLPMHSELEPGVQDYIIEHTIKALSL